MSKKILRIDDKMAKVARERQARKQSKTSLAICEYQDHLVIGVARKCDDGPLVNKSILVRNGTFDVHSVADLFFGCPSADPPTFFPDRYSYFYH